MRTVLHDLRYAHRALRRAPGFAAAAVVSLAIGIGANTAIFTVVYALLLRPLPYSDADRLLILWNRSPGIGISEDWFSTAQYFDIKTGTNAFEEVGVAIGANYNLTGTDGEPERVGTIRVSSNLLAMLGARPLVGRLIAAAEDGGGAPTVAVLGHGTWQRRYGGDPTVVGRSIILNGVAHQVIGVLPPEFDIPREVMPTLGVVEHAEVLINLPLAADAANVRNREDYNIVAKLKPGVSVVAAQAELDALTARLRREHPDLYPPNGGLTFSVVPLQEQVVGGVRRSLLVLVGAVALVLLVACANVAGLLLARAAARDQEVALRVSLGATRWRIVAQLLTESLLLAAIGGAAGLVLSALALNTIRVLGAASVPRVAEIALSTSALGFTALASIASGVFFGLVPAWRLTRQSLHATVKDGTRRTAATGRVLVAGELAITIVLLVGAGLLLRSFAQLLTVPPGFNPSNTLTLELTMTGRKYAEPQVVFETYRQLLDRLRVLPGVVSTGAVSSLPLSQMMAWGPITVEGRALAPGEAFINADQRMVAGDYFATMEIPLVRGRLFNEHDTRAAARVVLVDEHMARTLWPGEDAVGKRVRVGGADSTSPWLTIVGVVGRVKQDSLDSDPRIAMYFPHAQFTARAMNVVIRSADAAQNLAGVRQAIQSIDPDLPLYRVRTMDERVRISLATRRFAMLLLMAFAVMAMVLAVVGVYSVLAYVVNQRRREFGIRLALGSSPRGVRLLILRQGMLVTVVGGAIGVLGALVLAGFMESLLFGITTRDPLTFVSVPGVLLVASLAASSIPARVAARVDPMTALRVE